MQITCLATDKHGGVIKLMREYYSGIRHCLDLWHIVKNERKKLIHTKREAIVAWTPYIVNRLWHCAKMCKDNVRMLKEMWLGTLYHITNRHSWEGCTFYTKCDHSALKNVEGGRREERHTKSMKWLEPESVDFKKIRKLMTRKGLLKSLDMVRITCAHTLIKYQIQ